MTEILVWKIQDQVWKVVQKLTGPVRVLFFGSMENGPIRAEMIEAMEFPALSGRYKVSGVPQTTSNDGARHPVGALPEDKLLAALQETLQPVDRPVQ